MVQRKTPGPNHQILGLSLWGLGTDAWRLRGMVLQRNRRSGLGGRSCHLPQVRHGKPNQKQEQQDGCTSHPKQLC